MLKKDDRRELSADRTSRPLDKNRKSRSHTFWSRTLFILSTVVICSTVISAILQVRWLVTVAAESNAEIVLVEGRNTTCGMRKYRHECTTFSALLRYHTQSGDNPHEGWIPAGRARGHDRPVSDADLRMGQTVRVLYDPAAPDKFKESGLASLWAGRLFSLLIGLGMLAWSRNIR